MHQSAELSARQRAGRKSLVGVFAVIVGAFVVPVWGSGLAAAETCPGGYGDCTPANPTILSLTIETDRPEYDPGQCVQIKAGGFRPGSGDTGTITYAGEFEFNVVERGDGFAKPVGGNASSEAWPSGCFDASDPGSGKVCATSQGYTMACTGIAVGGVAVAGVELSRDGSSLPSSEQVRGGRRGLAFTGFQLGFLLAIALILLVVGANLRHWARRRRIQEQRAAARARAHRERGLVNR